MLLQNAIGLGGVRWPQMKMPPCPIFFNVFKAAVLPSLNQIRFSGGSFRERICMVIFGLSGLSERTYRTFGLGWVTGPKRALGNMLRIAWGRGPNICRRTLLSPIGPERQGVRGKEKKNHGVMERERYGDILLAVKPLFPSPC